MPWQDFVFTTGQIIFIISLLPSILSKDKPALTTSVMTAVVLYVFAIVDITLNLFLTAFTVGVTAVGWSILAYQKYQLERSK